MNKPVKPSLNPWKTALPPFPKPSITCLGFFIFYFSLFSSNYLSKVKAAKPVATAPVTFSTELRAPPIECVIKDEVPSAKPLPNYKGPSTKP